MNPFDVLVVGGGIVGLTSALGMARRGFTVGILDKASFELPQLDVGSRAYAINTASQRLLQTLEVWPQLDKKNLSPYRVMQIWDSRNQSHIYFDSTMVHEAELGHILTEAMLKRALMQAINQESTIALFSQAQIEKIETLSTHIELWSQDRMWKGSFVMITDGAQSTSRDLLQVPLTTWPYHQQAIIATVATEKPHAYTAYQVFNADGPLAFLPLADQNQSSIVWSTATAQAKHLLQLNDTAFEEALATAFTHKLGHVKLLSKRQSFPLWMRHAQQYQDRRWMLLGDAAHTIHPLAGLGLNLGFADLDTWLKELTQENNRITPKALMAYQRKRKVAVWQVILLMEGIKGLFLHSFPPINILRGLGLTFCDRFLPLKKRLIAYAQGPL